MALWSLDKLKPVSLHYQSSYSHQTLQDGNLLWCAPTHKFTWPLFHVVLQDHMTNENHYISTARVPMTTKLVRMVNYLDGLLPLKSHHPLIMWSCKIMRQETKLIYLHYHSAHGHQNWKDSCLPCGAPNHKVIYYFDNMVLQCHVTNWNHHISPTRVLVATKIGRMITYLDGLLHVKSLNT